MKRWFILRTGGGQTLALAASLRDAGYEAWTPGRTLRRSMPAKTLSGKRIVESEVPILPTFVFASDRAFAAIAGLTQDQGGPHPAFSVFRQGGRVPLVGNGEIAGLRDEEARQAAIIKAIHDAESHAEAERIRVAAIKHEAARRRAERAVERRRREQLLEQREPIVPGVEVEVIEEPMFVGIRGVFEKAEGPWAHVTFGTRSWKIEGWRVLPAPLNDNAARKGIAA